jgi:hypothetical protein
MTHRLGPYLVLALPLALLAATAADNLVTGRDGVTVGYQDTPILPWTKYHKHDPDRPQPPKVTPGQPTSPAAPSDAVVLFDGDDLDRWQSSQWRMEDGALVVTAGDLVTKQSFGDCQLHLEWQAPDPPRGKKFDRGNSGVFFMQRYEIQICDSYTEAVYPDGSAAAVYGETPPLVNATRPPGQWQSYDIFFTAPRFDGDRLVEPATVTMLHNNVLVHLGTVIHGPVSHRTIKPYEPHPARLPLMLQAHNNPVRFRNIWIRPLDREPAKQES